MKTLNYQKQTRNQHCTKHKQWVKNNNKAPDNIRLRSWLEEDGVTTAYSDVNGPGSLQQRGDGVWYMPRKLEPEDRDLYSQMAGPRKVNKQHFVDSYNSNRVDAHFICIPADVLFTVDNEINDLLSNAKLSGFTVFGYEAPNLQKIINYVDKSHQKESNRQPIAVSPISQFYQTYVKPRFLTDAIDILIDINDKRRIRKDMAIEKKYLSEFVSKLVGDLEIKLLQSMDQGIQKAVRSEFQSQRVIIEEKKLEEASPYKKFKTAFFKKYVDENRQQYARVRQAARDQHTKDPHTDSTTPDVRAQFNLLDLDSTERQRLPPREKIIPQEVLEKFLAEPSDAEMASFWVDFFSWYSTRGKKEFMAEFEKGFFSLLGKKLLERQLKKEVWKEYMRQGTVGSNKIYCHINGISLRQILSFLFKEWF